jgi:hypothetical protein
VRVRGRSAASGPPEPGTLRIEPASLVSQALVIAWGSAPIEAGDQSDLLLGAHSVIWAGPPFREAWERLAVPLPRAAHVGRIDNDRPWVVVEPSLLDWARSQDELRDAQLHHLGTPRRAPARGVAYWRSSPAVVASLLGRASAVVARPGPLAWDALRANRQVLAPPSPGNTSPTARDGWQLAHIVPDPLALHPPFWEGLARALAEERPPAIGGTAAWLRASRELAEPSDAPPRLLRKLRKLQRDPAAFLRDSRFTALKRAGESWRARKR